MAISLGDLGWRWKIGLFLLPTLVYGLMMIGQKFPVQERVAADVSYTDMMREFGLGRTPDRLYLRELCRQ